MNPGLGTKIIFAVNQDEMTIVVAVVVVVIDVVVVVVVVVVVAANPFDK